MIPRWLARHLTPPPLSVSADCLRHHARAEMGWGVDLPYWPAQRKGAVPYFDRKPVRLTRVKRSA